MFSTGCTQMADPGEFGDSLSMVDNEQDDLVEVFSSRKAVSSGEPSLDGSIDEERAALSDSDLLHAARTQTIATQVKGPSSDALEGTCKMEHEARERGDEWEDVLGSEQLWKKTLKIGAGHHRVRDGQWITVKVVDTLRGVDSHEQLRFITGFGMVIDAWELVVKLMVEGEVCAIRTAARFAYGEEGQLPEIGSNLQMEYTIELLEVGESPRYMEMSEEDLTDFVIMVKERGNYYFSRKEYEKAIFVYKRALGLVDTPDESDGLRKLFSALHSNLAVCYSKLEDWPNVLESASVALDLHALNTKALFRRAGAYTALNEIDKATDDLKKALSIDPKDAAVARELDYVNSLRKHYKNKEKEIYKRMVAGLSSEDYPAPRRSPYASLYEFFNSPKHILVITFFVVMLALFVHFLLQMS